MTRGPGGGGDAFFERRLRFVMVGVAFVFLLFLVRLFQLQILEGENHRLLSQQNFIRTVRIEAPRGDVVDRDGRVLATTRPAFDLEVIPSELREPSRTFAVLARLLDTTPEDLRQREGNPRGRDRFQPAVLAEDLSHEHLARVETLQFALPGVVTEVRPRREYPYGRLAAQVLGTVGEIGPDQLASPQFSGYRAGEVVGQSGIEALLEPELHGHPGGRNVVVDVAGREMELLDEVEPRPGARVTLALDLDLQRVAQEAFEHPPDGEPPKSGALVALDPRTGDVLALVSEPSFNPNEFAGGIDAAAWHRLLTDPRRPLQDRAIAGQYPPGSTYKPFVAAAALADGAIKPTTELFCPGFFRLGRRVYRCWKRAGHGHLDVHEALVHSCDVFFYQVGLRVGIDKLAQTVRSFGFGSPTGLALAGEKAGLVPTTEWKEHHLHQPWVLGETVSASIGQGFDLVTPLQLAVAYAAIANGGKVLRPRLILSVTDRNGRVLEAPQPEVTGHVDVPAEVLARIRRALRDVVKDPHGTGTAARLPGIAVAGKTGTAQVVRLAETEGLKESQIPRAQRDHAWFAAFAPAQAPQIVVVVLVEHGGHGGSAAAPIARSVLKRYFEDTGQLPVKPPERQAARRPNPAGGEGARAAD